MVLKTDSLCTFTLCAEETGRLLEQLVYEQPDLPSQARNRLWRRREQEYFPFYDYTGNPNLEQGCGWQRIIHIFQWPFYAIGYALVCAL